MAFVLPTFNVTVNIWRFQPPPPGGPPQVVTLANLSIGRRVTTSADIGDLVTAYGTTILLLPALTDIRDAASSLASAGDLVEAPAGSGRFYYVYYVDDFGKGFANEHRFAYMGKAALVNGGVFGTYVWPIPIP